MKLMQKAIALALAGCMTWGIVSANERLSTRQLRDLVKNGTAEYAVPYADRLLGGDETDVDLPQGVSLMRQAAEKQKADGKFGLGLCYLFGYGELDLINAYNYLLSATEMGYTPALTALGHCYEEGLGVPSNYHEARRCFFGSAPSSLDAQCMAVQLLRSGRTPFPSNSRELGQNVGQALAMFQNTKTVEMTPAVYRFLKQNAEQSRAFIEEKISSKHTKMRDMSAAELYSWGRLYELAIDIGAAAGKEPAEQMHEHYRRSAEKKYAPAQIALARLQAYAGDAKGLAALRSYADMGYYLAKTDLLELYEKDLGRDPGSDASYLALLQDLHSKGYHSAFTRIADYYASVKNDPQEAWRYTLKAADDGEALGCYRAAEFYRTGSCELPGIKATPDPDKAYAYLNTLCSDLPQADYRELDMCHCFTILGNMYMYGKGCVPDRDRAEEWYNVALLTLSGDRLEAKFRLGCC
ncbi:sel1 repeat family protein, partial [bacterium]|nr:sel1 repeat family protein [bacterium]